MLLGTSDALRLMVTVTSAVPPAGTVTLALLRLTCAGRLWLEALTSPAKVTSELPLLTRVIVLVPSKEPLDS